MNNSTSLLLNQSMILLKDHMDLILQSNNITNTLFYSIYPIDISTIIKDYKNLKIDVMNLNRLDEDNIVLNNIYDLIITFLSLHYSNDLIGSLIQYKRYLQARGSFLSIIFGGNTLIELKKCFIEIDTKIYQKSFPRIIPMIEIESITSILKRANYYNSIISIDKIKLHYNNLQHLLYDLKNLGQRNFLLLKNTHYDYKSYFRQVNSLYLQEFGVKDKIVATFEYIILLYINH